MKQLALAAPLAMILLFLPAFAQEENATQGSLRLQVPDDGEPVLEQMSEKGTYLVQLRWPQDGPTPQAGLQIELVFVNASSPQPTEENFPQAGANETGKSGFTDPGMTETLLPVESYDIAIYAGDGRVLWEKTDQPGEGGRGSQSIDFEGNYTGPVTINVTNIRPGWDAGETVTAEDLTDSVSFSATVVPEFPVALALLAGGVAAVIAAARLKRARVM
ncbi:MAG TPA: hypothetical protein VFS46_07925 [Nitrososphaera sp.]|nr:hypothetical protein [Nitrososphaera sp.]